METRKLRDFDQARYTQTYRRKHPEKVQKWQETSYANYLRKHGWQVTPPDSRGMSGVFSV